MEHGTRAGDKGWLATEQPQRLRVSPTERDLHGARWFHGISSELPTLASFACWWCWIRPAFLAFYPMLACGGPFAANLPRPHTCRRSVEAAGRKQASDWRRYDRRENAPLRPTPALWAQIGCGISSPACLGLAPWPECPQSRSVSPGRPAPGTQPSRDRSGARRGGEYIAATMDQRL